ncbi:putative phage minor tail protein [[Actinobacillus] rossii]|uniref:Putative phage minor tail protein n=1 Tax=[Actinobacillus] rossii TaxID=123820 RepID=A0A380TX13_9PAST|nr:putative phage minor tail protein [[Actinobacillus] rossii]
METFNFNPDWGMQLNKKPEVFQVGFGDGYEQVSPKGLNHILRVYDVSFSGPTSRIKQIDDFLNKQGGVKAFLWTPHDSTQGKFRCDEWKTNQQQGFWTLSAQFREVIL